MKRALDIFLQNMRMIAIVATLCWANLALANKANGQSKKPLIDPPRPIKLGKPDCSTGHSCHGLHGVVVVTVNVLTDGTVGDAKATVKSGDPRLVDDALIAAKLCRFQPGKFNGEPRSMNFDVVYRF